MTILPALRPTLRSLSSFVVALLMAGPALTLSGDPPSAAPAVETLSLASGASLEREIRSGEAQSFDLPLNAGTFLFMKISLRGVRLSFRLLSPGGEILSEVAGFGPYLLTTIADHEGTYRLESVASKDQRASTQFTVKILDLRPTAPNDRVGVRAAKNLTDALHLISLDGEEQRRQAEALLVESVTAWRAMGDARGEVEALVERAALRSKQGDANGALASYEDALRRSRESGIIEQEARALTGRGLLYSQIAQHDDALESFRAALDLWRRVGGPYEQATALQRLGQAYERKQDFESALKTFQEALSLAEEVGDLPQQANILSSIGADHYYLGRPGTAREIWERALNLSRQGGNKDTDAILENNLAVLYHNQGQFQRAVAMYAHLVESVPFKDSGTMRSNMGSLYLEMGNPEEALEHYESARRVYRALGDIENEVKVMVNLGRVRQRMGDPQAALAEYEKARGMLRQVPWSVFHYIGLAQIELGNPSSALSSLEKALENAKESRDPSKEAATLLAFGSAYAKLGQTDAALNSLQKVITIANEIGYQSAMAPALLERALLRRNQGQVEGGLADIKKALEIIESTRRNIAGDQFRIGYFATKRTYYDLEIDLLMRLDRSYPGIYKAQAFEASERARARGLLDLLAEGRIDLSLGLAPDLRRREDDLFDKISRAQRRLRDGDLTPERSRELQDELRRLGEQRKQLDRDIRASNKRYAEVRYPTPLALAEIQGRILDDHTALLEYALGERGSVLFVVTRQAINTYELPAAEEIVQRVRRWRISLERESLLTRGDYFNLAFQLYQDLLAPASGALTGKTSLLIVPDGALNYIPFEALLTEPAGDRAFKELPYLLRRYSIAYIPSASVLAGLREPREEPVPADRKEVAAFAPFAGPRSDSSTRKAAQRSAVDPSASRRRLDSLPASRQEITGIAELYPDAALSFVGDEADEEAVTHNPSVAAARRLHFATHAQIDERYPEYSALVLAERPREDGLLQVYEIFNLKLSADLAVLSACQTALGKEVTGEGLVGLSRAFFYAGVPSLVVSLWNVVDGPTPELMLDFYKSLDRLENKAEALQVAKLSMISRAAFSHPSFWAPFILLGEPR